MFKSKKDVVNEKITPDFMPMIRIVFWNSMGFFFFWFLGQFAVIQLFEATPTELGLSFSGQTFGGLVSAPIVGYLTDKMSKKVLVLIGSFGRGIAYIVMYIGILISILPVFAFGLFCLGFFVGFFWSPLDALIAQKSHKTYRSSAFGIQGGMLGWGNLTGSALSVAIFLITNIFVPNNHFLVYSPLVIFMLSNVYAGIKFNKNVDEDLTYETYSNNKSENEDIENKKEELTEGNQSDQDAGKRLVYFYLGFSLLVIAFMTSNINQTIAPPFFMLYLNDEIGVVNPVAIMLIYLPSQIVSLLLAPKMGKVADKISPALGIIFVSGFGALVTFLIINSVNGLMFAIILLLDSTFAWAGNLILQNVISRISKVHRGKIFGLARWMSYIGAVMGPLIGGWTYAEFGSITPFVISIFVELSVIPLYISAIKVLKPHMEEKLD
jgi:MFS family permease